MKNRQWILKTLSVLLVLSVLSASFGALIVFAEDGDGAQANSVTYGDTWDGTATDTDWETVAENTYSITSGAELAGLAAQVNAGNTYAGYTFLITENIDLNDQAWTPIGNDTTGKLGISFNGTLKGALGGDTSKPVTIGNMSVTGSTMRLALVGTQGGGGIENITMVNASVTKTGGHGGGCFIGKAQGGVSCSNLNVVNFSLSNSGTGFYYGGIVGVVGAAGDANNKFENCHVKGFTLNHTKATSKNRTYTGGFVGDVQNGDDATFIDCTVTGFAINATVNIQRVGGFVGDVNIAATFQDCSATDVTISTTGTGTYIGGFVGSPASSSTYTDCGVTTFKLYGETEQNAVTATYVGGFSGGAATYPSYTRCSANSIDLKINGNGGTQLVGGFTGMVRNGLDPVATFDTVTSSGTITVTGTPGTQFGGLIGIIRNNAVLSDCSSSVNLIFSDGGAQNVGGLVGNVFYDVSEVTITNCDFTGSITTSSGTNVGGLVGINIGMGVTLANCEMGGTVTITEGTNVGALVGHMTAEVKEDDVMVTKIGALTMENCTVTSNTGYDWFGVNTKDYDITLKNGDVEVAYNTLKVKYQKNTEDATALRLIATVNGDAVEGYQRVGFKLTNSEGQVATLWTQTVYQTITADGVPVTPSDEGYGASSTYFFAVNLTGVPANDTFTVQAFVETLEHVIVAGEVFNCCLANLT